MRARSRPGGTSLWLQLRTRKIHTTTREATEHPHSHVTGKLDWSMTYDWWVLAAENPTASAIDKCTIVAIAIWCSITPNAIVLRIKGIMQLTASTATNGICIVVITRIDVTSARCVAREGYYWVAMLACLFAEIVPGQQSVRRKRENVFAPECHSWNPRV